MHCTDCQAPITDGATRCRACFRSAWDAGVFKSPDADGLRSKPEHLWTGPELLERIWLDRPPLGTPMSRFL